MVAKLFTGVLNGKFILLISKNFFHSDTDMLIRLIALVLGTSLISCIPMPQYGQMGMPPSQMGIPPPPPMGMAPIGYGGQMMMTAPEPPYQKSPKHPIVYAPLPGR